MLTEQGICVVIYIHISVNVKVVVAWKCGNKYQL